MPSYPLICRKCGFTIEVIDSADTITDNLENGLYCCSDCGYPLLQDFASKGYWSDFHMTRDLYAQDLKMRGNRKRARGTYYDR